MSRVNLIEPSARLRLLPRCRQVTLAGTIASARESHNSFGSYVYLSLVAAEAKVARAQNYLRYQGLCFQLSSSLYGEYEHAKGVQHVMRSLVAKPDCK